MAGPPFDPAYSQHIIPHVEAARCLTLAGFSVLVWDHVCTLDDEIRFWWTAPPSLVKYLFLVNRYITPVGEAVAVYHMSRFVVFSDVSCRWGLMVVGFVETMSLAIGDLLLLFRVHALWGGRRDVVLGTYMLYAVAYCGYTAMGLISAVQIPPFIHYDPLAKACVTSKLTPTMSLIWIFTLSSTAPQIKFITLFCRAYVTAKLSTTWL